VLEQLGIRTMAKAKYATENIGHYGLGFENYCHFTSPIRRYPDVMVHRVLQQVIEHNLLPDKKMEEKYQPPIVKKVGEMAKQVGGHGGMDFLMDWRTIDCLRNGLPLDQDVYDAALWSSIAPLSEWSVANRSNSINVPDFTSGSWKTNQPIDIALEKGGTTKVLV